MALFRPNIAGMSGYQPGEQPQTGKFIKLNTNENPYPPSPAALRAMHTAIEAGLQKYPDPFANAFRQCASEVLGIPADWILCGNGSDDLLTVVTRAFVGEGQKIRMPHPSYVLYPTLAAIQGAPAEFVRFQDDWTLPGEFSRASPDVRLALLANPNSPSGTTVAPSRVAEMAAQIGCALLVDEAYGEFADADCLGLVGRNERVLVSRSMSKSHALAGIRFGYLVAQPQIIEQLAKVKDSYNCDAVAIAGATAAIADQAWLQESKQRILATRGRLTTELRRLGFCVSPSQANFVWCVHERCPARALYERLKRDRILVRYMSYTNWGDGLRITVGNDDQIDALLVTLQQVVS